MTIPRCKPCNCKLETGDDFERLICRDCQKHPDTTWQKKVMPVRDFGAAEKSLISRVHRMMPAQQLLDLLNERLVADLGAAVPLYSMQQLRAQIVEVPVSPDSHDWSSLRRLLGAARRDGVLERIRAQTIDDFATVFSLSPAQVVRLKDVALTQEQA